MKRAFSVSKVLLLGFLFILLFMFTRLDLFIEILEKGTQLESGFSLKLFRDLISSDIFLFSVPIISTLAFSASFVDEWRSGITRVSVSRISKQKYLKSKAITTAVSGAFTILGATLIVLCSIFIVLRPLEKTINFTDQGLLRSLTQQLITTCICGALWAELGMMFSTLLSNRFMAWLSPFMTYYLFVILHERYFSGILLFYPKEWMTPQTNWPADNWGLTIWLLCLVFLSGRGFIKIGGKKFEQI